jgi:hypothetical protein
MVIDVGRLGIENLASNDVSLVHGDPVTVRKGWDDTYPQPQHIYFIYIRPNNNRASGVTLLAKQRFEPLNGRTVAAAEEDLLKRSRPRGDKIGVVAYGLDVVDFQDIPCYVTLVIDKEHWHFFPDAGQPQAPAIVVRRNKVILNRHGVIELDEYNPNCTFYNFENVTVPDGGSGVSAVRLVNFFKKDRWGNPEYKRSDLNDEKEQMKQNRYAFDIYLRMPYYVTKNTPPTWATVIIDPTTPPRH